MHVRAALVAGGDQHLPTEVGADNGHTMAGGAVVGQGEVAGAGADVEDGVRRRPAAPGPWYASASSGRC